MFLVKIGGGAHDMWRAPCRISSAVCDLFCVHCCVGSLLFFSELRGYRPPGLALLSSLHFIQFPALDLVCLCVHGLHTKLVWCLYVFACDSECGGIGQSVTKEYR